MTKYIPKDNELVIRDILANCKKEHTDITFKIYDTETRVITSSDADKIITAIDGGDEEILFLITLIMRFAIVCGRKCKLQIDKCKLQIDVLLKLQIANCKLQIANCKLKSTPPAAVGGCGGIIPSILRVIF